jgi:diadenosine tetraphosphate (Ap4A) HIT family hydrolase
LSAAAGCYACERNGEGDAAPVRERIYDDGAWRVAHAFGTSRRGWLVVLAKRHIESLAELTAEEAVALGPLLRALTQALIEVTGASKTYVALFAEHPAHRHVHIHVIPRRDDDPAGALGPDVFRLVGVPPADEVPEDERDRVAAAIAASLQQHAGL